MMKLTILLALTTLGFALEDANLAPSKEDEVVTVLNFANHKITSLNDYDFSKYPLLEELDLSNNDIQYIHEDAFSKNLYLKKLNLSGNKHLQLPQFSTLLIANIEELDLSNCNIENLPTNIFDGLLDLKLIDLSANPLEEQGVKLFTLTNLNNPSKLILPYIDEELIKEICNELDMTIGIKHDEYEDTIQCSNVREGSWLNFLKEEPEIAEQTEIEDVNVEIKRQINPNDTQPATEETGNINSTTVQNETDLHSNTTEPESPAPVEPALPLQETQNNATTEFSQLENKDKNETESTGVEKPNIDIAEPTNVTQSETTESIPEVPAEETVTVREEVKPDKVEVNQTLPDQGNSSTNATLTNIEIGQNVSIVNDGSSNSLNSTQEGTQLLNQTNKEELPKGPMQRGVINFPLPPLPENGTGRAAAPEQKSEKMENKLAPEPTTGQSTETSAGTNVLVFLVIAVIVAGVGAFGYKFYKSRQHQAARASEPIERELKEIVVDKKTNGATNIKEDAIEEEPLIENRENSVEIREIEETVQTHEQTAKTNENSTPSSGPYVPTTAPAKPPHVNKDDK